MTTATVETYQGLESTSRRWRISPGDATRSVREFVEARVVVTGDLCLDVSRDESENPVRLGAAGRVFAYLWEMLGERVRFVSPTSGSGTWPPYTKEWSNGGLADTDSPTIIGVPQVSYSFAGIGRFPASHAKPVHRETPVDAALFEANMSAVIQDQAPLFLVVSLRDPRSFTTWRDLIVRAASGPKPPWIFLDLSGSQSWEPHLAAVQELLKLAALFYLKVPHEFRQRMREPHCVTPRVIVSSRKTDKTFETTINDTKVVTPLAEGTVGGQASSACEYGAGDLLLALLVRQLGSFAARAVHAPFDIAEEVWGDMCASVVRQVSRAIRPDGFPQVPLTSDPTHSLIPVKPTYFVNGCFDGVHVGHLTLLSAAVRESYANNCALVILINDDESVCSLKGRVSFPLEQRLEQVKTALSLLCVGSAAHVRVLPFSGPICESHVRFWRPDRWFKGPDYADRSFPELAAARECGCQIEIVQTVNLSGSAIWRKEDAGTQ